MKLWGNWLPEAHFWGDFNHWGDALLRCSAGTLLNTANTEAIVKAKAGDSVIAIIYDCVPVHQVVKTY